MFIIIIILSLKVGYDVIIKLNRAARLWNGPSYAATNLSDDEQVVRNVSYVY